jgi:diacylglycerol kinase (ATP)
MKKKIRFIINPKSGVKGKEAIPGLIESMIDKDQFETDIVFTEAPKQGTLLSREAAQKNYFLVVSVGGDGSANEVGAGLDNSNTAMGIIPTGSGNGMSRHLKIPMDIKKALQVIHSGKIEKIDTIRVNEEFCLGTIGIGFDAYVAHLFANSKKRGFSTYARLVIKEFYKYKPVNYEIIVDDRSSSCPCFLLTCANSSQWGNDAVIAPFADVMDGLIDISILKKFPLAFVPYLVYQLMSKSIHHSKYFSMMKGKNIVLKNNGVLKAHIDGEPITFNNDLHIRILPRSLSVLVPSNS